MSSQDTIYAVSTGAGTTAIAVIRVSGPRARFGLETLAGACPSPRRASVRALSCGGELLDRAVVLWLPGPASFTGEDMAEYHVHGGRAVVAGVLSALSSLGHRPAVAGEFTRRAFLAGRMDLTEVEGLADLLAAETAAQRRQALGQLEGRLGEAADRWRAMLVRTMALVEADLDFADEGDVASSHSLEAVRRSLDDVHRDLAAALRWARHGERLRDGLTVVLAGAPNAGKSTLLNALAGRDVAIVTPVPGTTRDLIEVRLDLGGVPVTIIDTAGLRQTADPVEQEGIRRTLDRASRADLVLMLAASSNPDTPGRIADAEHWLIATQVDSYPNRFADARFAISARTGDGMEMLVAALTGWASDRTAHGAEALVTRERHHIALRDAFDSVQRARDGLHPDRLELVAEDIRLGVRSLEALIGRVGVEDVLDALFAGFCIGK